MLAAWGLTRDVTLGNSPGPSIATIAAPRVGTVGFNNADAVTGRKRRSQRPTQVRAAEGKDSIRDVYKLADAKGIYVMPK